LNELVKTGKIKDVIRENIDLYNNTLEGAFKKFEEKSKKHKIKLMIVTGPSSSGKTTTTEIVKMKLEKLGLKLVKMNLDNYFWDIHQHPTDWVSDRNYESIEALDYQLINTHLYRLLKGEKIKVPEYNFHTGRREGFKEDFELKKNELLLWDSHLGICPYLAEELPRENMFIIYTETVNPLTDLKGNRVQFTDYRLCRRMLRDAKHRNHDPQKTLLHWHYVRKGELRYIIPLRKRADVFVNGAMSFDLPALKPDIDEIYPGEDKMKPYYHLLDARIRFERVRDLMKQVTPLEDRSYDMIPGDCVIREFIGGQTIEIPHQ
jgi:uridine kinase